MSTEYQLRVHVFSIFFIVALIYQEIEGMNDREIDVFMLLKNCKLQEGFDFTKDGALLTSSYFFINTISLWVKNVE